MSADIRDPETYRRMSEPLPSVEEANKAVEAFFADLRALREKHHIRDVLAVVQVVHRSEKGEVEGCTTLRIGSQAEALHMAAMAYGMMRSEVEQALDLATQPRRRGRSS